MVQHLEGPTAPAIHDELLEGLKELTNAEPKPQAAHQPPAEPFRRQIVWFNLLGFLALHVAAVYGLYLAVTQTMLLTIAWSKFIHAHVIPLSTSSDQPSFVTI